jgi:hypothetical protein
MRLTVIGNPGGRRVSLLLAAAQRAGLPGPVVLSWLRVLRGELSFAPGTLVRIESPGEDAEVDRLLRGAAGQARHGQIIGAATWFAGFASALERIAAAADEAGATLLTPIADILTMFDKAACHARLTAAGIAVPPALAHSPGSWEQLRASLAEVGWSRVFVKARYGSSASGVLALEFGGRGRMQATTSVELTGPALFNSLRVRRYQAEADIAAIIDRLAPDGLHVERWFPKADLDGHVVDLRVVVLGGRSSHVVVRGSKSPMTNLHLGGKRIDLELLRSAAGPAAYEAALDTCDRVGQVFAGASQLGVDLMFGPSWRRHAVAEVNAFGDLLPHLLVNGLDTYETQLRSLAPALAGKA